MKQNSERFYYMDTMRAVIIIFVVIFHTALIFNPAQSWVLKSAQTAKIYGYIVTSIPIRMPLLFIISGFFTCKALLKNSTQHFLLSKFHRIFIPFIFIGFTVNLMEVWYLAHLSATSVDWYDYIHGGWVMHLWFLEYLCIYFIIYALLYEVNHAFPKLEFKSILNCFVGIIPRFLLIFILPLSLLGVLFSNKLGFPLYSSIPGFPETYSLIYYLIYFSFGILLYLSPELLNKFQSISFYLTIPLIFISWYVAKSFNTDTTHLIDRIGGTYFHQLYIWDMIAVIFMFFTRFGNVQSPIISRFTDSSYTIYLLHIMIIVLVGSWLLPYHINVHLLFAIIALTACILSYALHEFVISRIPILRYLVNGRVLEEQQNETVLIEQEKTKESVRIEILKD